MKNTDSECKQRIRKVAKLGVKCVWLVVDFPGDLHHEPVSQHGKNFGTLKKITQAGDDIQIKFSQNNYTWSGGYMPERF